MPMQRSSNEARTLRRVLAPTLALTLAACASPPTQHAADASRYRPVASIQDIMQSIVDPSADALWDSVSTETTAAGVEEKRPHSDAEWGALRQLAVRLVEASNLLVVEGRAVAQSGRELEDAKLKGILAPAEIRRRIDAAPSVFIERAHDLQHASELALAAVEARDAERLLQAGSSIDHACEQCHLGYWYPNGGPPAAR